MRSIQLPYNDLINIVSESVKRCLLSETASPVVWHWTTPENLLEILTGNEFILSDASQEYHTQNAKLTGYGDKRPYYFSTTRSKNSHDGYSNTLKKRSEVGAARIQLDGNKLNYTLHAKAGLYHSSKRKEYSDTSIKGHWTNTFVKGASKLSDIKKDEAPSQNEKEDTFWSTNETISNASKYIQRIDLLVYQKTELISDIENLCYDLDISLYLYDDEESFNLQSKNYFDEERQFQNRLQYVLNQIEKGTSRYYLFDNIDELPNCCDVVELQGRYNIFNEDGDFVLDYWSEDPDEVYEIAYQISSDEE